MSLNRPLIALSLALTLAACRPDTAVDADGSAASSGSPDLPVVTEIIDGDTIVVNFGTSRDDEIVRLLGIDTPESVDPNRPVQCFGGEATARIAQLIPVGTRVTVSIDQEPRDQYGRLLGYVHRAHDALFVNETLLREGFADVSIYEPNTAFGVELRHAARTARTSNVGLWSHCGGPDVPVDPPARSR